MFNYVNDHLGMPKELIDQAGKVAWAAAYSAWGRMTEARRDPTAKRVESPFRLLGQYADSETGLCFTRFRYFDAEVGRWCSPDPLGIEGGNNLLGFNASPSVGVDPFGLEIASDNYRGRYQADLWGKDLKRLPDDWDAHHRIPQVLKDHPEFSEFDFHDPSNIQGVKGARADTNVHQQITNDWEAFRKENPTASREQIEKFAKDADGRYGDQFWKGC